MPRIANAPLRMACRDLINAIRSVNLETSSSHARDDTGLASFNATERMDK
jgi:hypothetical protein